jgi:uncharacterized protein
MNFEEIRHALETAPRMPEAALREARAHADKLLPIVLGLIDKLKTNVYLLPEQDRLLFYGIHVLASVRSDKLWSAWCDLLRLPSDRTDDLFGDHLVTTVVAVTLSLVGDDVVTVSDLLVTPTISENVRWALFQVLASMTWAGQTDIGRTRAFLERFEAEGLAAEDDAAWEGWLDAVVLLGLVDFMAAINRVLAKPAFRYFRPVDRAEAFERLEAAAADCSSPQRFIDDHIMRIDDPVEALGWLKRIEQSKDEAEAKQEKPDPEEQEDPAADIWLTDEEQGWLRGFLSSAQVPDTTMSLEELDGFFCALIAGPETVLPSEYMPYIWGGDEPAEGPVYDSEAQLRFVLDLLMRYWNGIARRVAENITHPPFLFGADDADRGRDWATGFLGGLALRREAWVPLFEHGTANGLVHAIMALYKSDPDVLGEPVTPALRREIIEELPEIVLSIADFWRDPQSRHVEEPRRSKKVGRNEPCPCGSGRKYKKCCGASAGPTLH